MSRLSQDHLASLEADMKAAFTDPRPRAGVVDAFVSMHSITLAQAQGIFNRLRDKGQVEKIGNHKQTKWKTLMVEVPDLAEVEKIVNKLSPVNKELETQFLLLIIEIGDIKMAKRAFDSAIERLRRIK